MAMLSFHNDPAIKAKYVERIKRHRAADELVAGTGWSNGIGCAVGCTFECYDYSRGPIEIGFPSTLIALEDEIFEGLARTGGDYLSFPTLFLEDTPVGVDLELVAPRLFLWLLSGADSPIPVEARNPSKVKDVIDGVAALYEEWLTTGIKPEQSRWAASARAASSAVWAARASWAAVAAVWAARAAWAASHARAASARKQAWESMRDKLLQLMREA